MTVRCRQEDVRLVKVSFTFSLTTSNILLCVCVFQNVVSDAVRSYEQATKKTCKVIVDSTHLPAEW